MAAEAPSLSELDPHCNLLLNQRAVIAALTDPRLKTASIADLEEMDLGNDAPKEGPQLLAYRREIQRVRWLVAPQSCPEAYELLAGLEGAFVHQRDKVMKDFGFKKAGKPSDFSHVHTSFTPHELLGMKKLGQQPRLTLEPDLGDHQLNFVAMILAMNRAKMGGQIADACVNKLFGRIDPRMLEGKPVTGFFPHFIDRRREMESYDGDDVARSISDRLTAHSERKAEHNVHGMTRNHGAAGMMEFLYRGEPNNTRLYDVLDDDSILSSSLVPYVSFYNGHPRFYVHSPGLYGLDHFRVAAGGKRAV